MKSILCALILSSLSLYYLPVQAKGENESFVASTEIEVQDSPLYRHYQIGLPFSYSPEVSSTLGVLGNQMFQDINQQLIKPLIPGLFGDILSEAWKIFWTYEFTIWPHEFGHWTRAAQVNSQFIFHDVNPFLPYTTVEMGANTSEKDQALLSIGGFEVNSLIARKSQMDLYKNNYAFTDELVHAWVNKSFFPIYAFLVIPQNPELPETWINTGGDPVHFVLPTYQRYTGNNPVTSDNKVQTDLIQYYNESIYLSAIWELLDPIFYQTLISGILSKSSQYYEPIKPIMLLGDENNGWTYGTLFNPSPLGYELYLYNYLKINKKLYSIYLKYGRPAQNLGMGIGLPDIIKTDNFSTGISFDVWQQEYYHFGAAMRVDSEYFLDDHWGLFLNALWKSEGYLMGQSIGAGMGVYTGLSYRYEVHSL